MSVSMVIGELRQVARLFGPGEAIPDGDGGFTLALTALNPSEWRCSLEPASVRAIERRFAGTVTGQATHILTGRYHPGVTLQTSVRWTDRAGREHTANVIDYDDTEGAGVELVLLVAEVKA